MSDNTAEDVCPVYANSWTPRHATPPDNVFLHYEEKTLLFVLWPMDIQD
ncbi:hypothetical protein [Citrobacter amalonaticus]